MAYWFIGWVPLGLINGLNKYGLLIVIGSLALGGLLCWLILKRITNDAGKWIVSLLYVTLCVLLLGFYVYMGWMPLWLIRLLGEQSLPIVGGLGVFVVSPLIPPLVTEVLNKKKFKFPRWIAIPFVLYIVFIGFYFIINSQKGFQIEEELFNDSSKNYYYVGRVKGGKAVGKGRQFYSVDERLAYIGGFKDNRRYGKGTLYDYAENGDILNIYTGQWVDNKQNGQGMIKYASGDRYEGNFVNGVRGGKGTLEYANGDTYVGNFKDGSCHDEQGRLYFANRDTYVGNFANGVRDGRGRLDYASGDRKYYDGPWENDKASGSNGTLEYANGDTYVGGFVDGKRDGSGKIEYANGDWYEGEWKNDMRQGFGIGYDSAEGTTYDGEWKEDKRDGTGVLTLPNGVSKKARFFDGKFKEWF